ncbi:chaplin [Streptacidiphilus sp. N1-12]|uniref:Chaplin n=2 Tax=Streptacidiphilus alkalitolerans TaxID=3342712 RepID=A0ABV6VJW6_9ACTN
MSTSKHSILFVTAAAAGLLAAGAGAASASSDAAGGAFASPGVGSGNAIQVPVHVPVNLCGNSVNVIGLVNPAFGNTCHNAG